MVQRYGFDKNRFTGSSGSFVADDTQYLDR